VEDVLFKLPRYYFEQNSRALRPILFSTPSENVKRFAGDQIIHLDGISEKDFRLMLKVAFPESLWGRLGPESGDAKERPVDILGASELRCWKDWASVLKVSTQLQLDSIRDVSVRRLTSSPTSVEDWVGVLRMATEWEVWEVRETAIRRLGSARAAISLLDKIDLALECKVEEWLLKGYQQLVERNEVISSEEEGRLGWKTTSGYDTNISGSAAARDQVFIWGWAIPAKHGNCGAIFAPIFRHLFSDPECKVHFTAATASL
jgi:hypothetical protein